MREEHKKIERMLSEKINSIQRSNLIPTSKENELSKFEALQRLISNQYNTFFNKIDINIAINILKDIGINQEEIYETYKKLLQEEIGKKYILMNIDEDNKEERE